MKHKQWGQENVGNKADEICEGAINSQILFVTMPTNIFNPDHHPIDPCVAGDAAQTDATQLSELASACPLQNALLLFLLQRQKRCINDWSVGLSPPHIVPCRLWVAIEPLDQFLKLG